MARASATSTAIERDGELIADGHTGHATVDADRGGRSASPTWFAEADRYRDEQRS